MSDKKQLIGKLLSQLTLEEKIALVAGHNSMFTNTVPRLDIPSIRMSDGPHGLRIQGEGDLGAAASQPATAFPTASCSANTWDPELTRKMGNAMAEEAQYYGINVILGPGVNIKRNPRCGRNFEYFSEDPFLAGRMGAGEVIGIQEKGVGVSLKHFACNNNEDFRFMGNAIVDERALREIYLRQFEYIVKETKPETVMCAYNKLNGTHCSENDWLLNKVLRDEWGFKGLVMSDWGTTHNRIKGVKSGLDLEMPGDTKICRKWLYDAVNSGELSLEDLDKAVKNVLELVYKHTDDKRLDDPRWLEHNELAKEIALHGAVLLKNDGGLPLNKEEPLLVIGELFEKMRYQGAGSSLISPYLITTPKDAFDKNNIPYKYVKGYKEMETAVDESLIKEAVEASKDYEKVVLFIGLTDIYESEGMDRENISLPDNQLALVDALINENKKIVIVLYGGSVVELPFFDNVNSLLNMFLPGQNGGDATYELLFGLKNPCGRLVETWPISYSDVPFGNEYVTGREDPYKESIYVGYRYYSTKGMKVRFPFGYGLSYTTFEYNNLKVQQNDKEIVVTVDVKNSGAVDGNHIVQAYVSVPRDSIHKPIRELKGFTKLFLQAKESKNVEIRIDKEELRYWHINEHKFVLEDGEYDIQIGRDVDDIVLSQKIKIKGEIVAKTVQKAYELLDFSNFTNEEYEQVWGVKIPEPKKMKPFTLDSKMSEIKHSFFGKILYNVVVSVATKPLKKAKKMKDGVEKDNIIKGSQAIKRMIDTSSLTTLTMAGGPAFPYNYAEGVRDLSNGRLFKGIGDFCRKFKCPALPIENKEVKK